ncbi:MAG: hypothetical protein JSV88_29215 [Candidatus Aminicenantes bacterium]|nr:MAG: hypothetical protein JSV88_29215 [Candidatus Aminicenantes bacterium]
MSPLKEVPLENLDMEYITALKDFVHPVLFPFKKNWKDQRILYVGENEEILHLMESQFPEAVVQRLAIDSLISEDHKQGPGAFDYIAAAGLKSAAPDICPLLSRLISLLKPGGVIASGVYGYAGYYGLDMLGTIVKHFAADIKNIHGKNFPKIKRITASVIHQLPKNHPAFHRKAFMERLSKGEPAALKELVNISTDKIFTVSRLLECIEQCGGQFIDWVIPKFYDPAQYVEKKEVAEKLEKLKEPQRWQVAELVNASPPDHYFFLGREDHQPVKIAWDSGDIYLWRPKRLPLFQWEDPEDSNGCTLRPIKECESIGSIELQSWQAQLCLAASGTTNLNQLLVDIKIPHSGVGNFLRHAVNMRLLAVLPPGDKMGTEA